MNQPNPNAKPFIPSAEHRWGLARISAKKMWVGLTEREFALMYEWIAGRNPDDWLMWVAGWQEWKPLAGEEKIWEFHMPIFSDENPQPEGMPRRVPR